MRATVSISGAAGYGDSGGENASPQPLSVSDAIHHTVHNYPGGVAALAVRFGMSANTLQHKVNPNANTHHLHPQELLSLMQLSGDASVLHAMAAALGYTVTRATPDQSGGDPVEAFTALQSEFANFVRAAADALQSARDSGGYVTANQVRRAQYALQESQAAHAALLAALRGRVRPAPAVE